MLRSPAPRSLPQPGHRYDVAVVGAGLAGCELAWRLARTGQDVLLVSQALDNVGNLFHARVPSAFPDGSLFELARATLHDTTNWSLHREVKRILEETSGIHLLQSCVTALEAGEPHVLSTWEGPKLTANVVVLAVGSFLGVRLRVGDFEEEAGRLGEVAYDFLWRDLAGRAHFQERRDTWNGDVPYDVAYHVISRLALPNVHVLGRCAPGEKTYSGVLDEAARLAAELAPEKSA